MIRRTFLKSMAGAFAASLVNLRQSIDTERLLSGFCDPDHARYDFASPFGIGNLTYATDAYAIARSELVKREEYGERRLPPNVNHIWSLHWDHNNQWVPIQEFMTPVISRDDNCPECGERRIFHGDQYPADNWPVLLDYDPDTNTSRDASCVLCKGRPYKGKNTSLLFGIEHSTYRLRRIATLPNAVVTASTSTTGSILFKADGFEGISMGFYEDPT